MAKSRVFVLAGLIATGHASQVQADPTGPSFSCARTTASIDPAERTIERAICADPALAKLDLALDGAFHGAIAKDPGDKAYLLDSQRAWLKSRVMSCHVDREGTARPELNGCLGELYRARLAALRDHDPSDTPVCRAIAGRIREVGGYLATYSLGQGLRDDPGSPIVLGKAEPVTKALEAKLPDAPSIDNAGDNSLYHFGAIRSLFAIDSVQGTARCEYISMYKIVKGGAFAVLDAVEKNQDPDCGGTTFFGSVADPAKSEAPVALYVAASDTISGSSLAFTSRRDDSWHPACTIATTFDTKLAIGRRFCAKGVDCDALAQRALDLARRRDAAGPDAPARLGAGHRVTAEEEKEQIELPTFGATNVDAWATFVANAPVYEVAGPDGPLFMRISHGTVGWRTDENWLVGVYDSKGKELRPLAGFMIEKSRSRLRDVSVR